MEDLKNSIAIDFEYSACGGGCVCVCACMHACMKEKLRLYSIYKLKSYFDHLALRLLNIL